MAAPEPRRQHPEFVGATSLTLKRLFPSHLLEKMEAGLIISEDPIKFAKVFRVFHVSHIRFDPKGQSSAYAGHVKPPLVK